jgi:hypothetical protein
LPQKRAAPSLNRIFQIEEPRRKLPKIPIIVVMSRPQVRWANIPEMENRLVKYENGDFKTSLKTKETTYITSLFEDRSGRF